MKWSEVKNAKFEIGKIIQNMNSTTCCFTGHRVQKLPWRSDEKSKACIALKATLRSEIEKAIQRGYKTFLCGMALGFDTYCAEAVLELKKQYPDIKLVGALPCENQDSNWSAKNKARYRLLLNQLDKIRCIYEKYTGVECMFERNRYMVNNSSLMIALFNGKPGGTQSTIEYARQQGLEIRIIKPEI